MTDDPKKKEPTGCHGGKRHWFTTYGYVGSRRTACARCGAPNPRAKRCARPDCSGWTFDRIAECEDCR